MTYCFLWGSRTIMYFIICTFIDFYVFGKYEFIVDAWDYRDFLRRDYFVNTAVFNNIFVLQKRKNDKSCNIFIYFSS